MKLGLTKLMLESIKRVVLWWTPAGLPRRIGNETGAPGEVLQRCIARMCAMTKLAITVVQTEFPHFDVMLAFHVLNLDTAPGTDDSSDVVAARDDAFKRLAHVFSVNENDLRAQYDRLVGVAKHVFVHEGLSNQECWKKALDMTQSRSENRTSFPVDALLRVLVPYTAWRCSTSGVEQNFSLRDWIAPQTQESFATAGARRADHCLL